MKVWETGMFARSLAGRDKGNLYVIIAADEEYVYLADGKGRPVSGAKKKKRRHVQIDYHRLEFLQECVQAGRGLRDEDIKRAIKIKEAKC